MKKEDYQRLKEICEREGFTVTPYNDVSIVVTKKEKELPKSWEDLGSVSGYFVEEDSKIFDGITCRTEIFHKNIFVTEEQAKASIALAQLSQLRDVYRNGWEPDWGDVRSKWCIVMWDSVCDTKCETNKHYFLSFQDESTAELFLSNFRDLIEDASPLLFG
jgi:hypothetical protein